jgi:hypothetical protein
MRRGVAWRGVAWRGVAWRGVAWRGVAWRGVAWRGATHSTELENVALVSSHATALHPTNVLSHKGESNELDTP